MPLLKLLRTTICLLTFAFLIQPLPAQESFYSTGSERVTVLGSPVLVGDSVYFSIATFTSPDHNEGAFNRYASLFMVFDQNGKLGSSILHPDTNNLASDSVFLNKLGESVDSGIMFFAYQESLFKNTPPPKARTFGVYNIDNRKIIRQVALDTSDKLGPHIVEFFAQDSAHLIVGGTAVLDPFSTSKYEKFYSIYDNNYNLIRTKVDTGSYGGSYNNIQLVDSKFFIFHRDPTWEEFEVLNSDLSIDTILERSSSYPWPGFDLMRRDFAAIPNAHGQGFYLLSLYLNGNYAVLKFNEDYSVASVDSFRVTEVGYNNYASPSKNPFSWNSPDTIYGTVGLWEGPNLINWNGMDTVGRSKPFKIVQFDTTGTVHWSRLIGRDSAVYFPYQLQATDDGGVLVFSFLYDSQYSTQIHSRLSVIKIGADGSVLHDNEYDLPQSGELALYPNPVKEDLHVRMPRELAAQGDYRIFSMRGGTQLGGRFTPEQAINVEALLPGTYMLHLHLDNGLVQSGRFLKK